MGEQWFLKTSDVGKVQGPFPRDQLQKYASEGRLRANMSVSTDKINWICAKNSCFKIPADTTPKGVDSIKPRSVDRIAAARRSHRNNTIAILATVLVVALVVSAVMSYPSDSSATDEDIGAIGIEHQDDPIASGLPVDDRGSLAKGGRPKSPGREADVGSELVARERAATALAEKVRSEQDRIAREKAAKERAATEQAANELAERARIAREREAAQKAAADEAAAKEARRKQIAAAISIVEFAKLSDFSPQALSKSMRDNEEIFAGKTFYAILKGRFRSFEFDDDEYVRIPLPFRCHVGSAEEGSTIDATICNADYLSGLRWFLTKEEKLMSMYGLSPQDQMYINKNGVIYVADKIVGDVNIWNLPEQIRAQLVSRDSGHKVRVVFDGPVSDSDLNRLYYNLKSLRNTRLDTDRLVLSPFDRKNLEVFETDQTFSPFSPLAAEILAIQVISDSGAVLKEATFR